MRKNPILLLVAALILGAAAFVYLPLHRPGSETLTGPLPAGAVGEVDVMPDGRTARDRVQSNASSIRLAESVPEQAHTDGVTFGRNAGDSVQEQGHLPLESQLLTGGFLNQGSFDLLESTAFDAFYDRFDKQNFGVANELTTAYRDQLDADLRAVGQGRHVDRLSCATDVCIGTIRESRGDSWFDDWYNALQSKSPRPIMALTQASVSLPGGDIDHRLMFTTRPGSGGFALGMNPPRR